ncbi:MAG: 50S ribosomal protein L1 [Dehalococcoidales bacterium]|jgi:large subunit ribosomal protein L1|nr:50S ribosomal protein L1 [Dehalococcoidales bacterium]MDP6647692.1 50S ribosomal protein L1 [Dehalococcoidales bacterium]MDP6737648.1 50S ribosomal protein L1 [Dehalococcoidales bacterium]MDP7109462.1 50S ribosomal protein L1 [Dehalococcoidales bacterium]MDP7309978.1 50S ribosomal protein L1 [Dehalococcoidales bacterium]|tara:strand:+ start:4176 stop:4889 length:714 start_codon:yes stop_codon:yes gene_type:complete
MKARSKKYLDAVKLLDIAKEYTPGEAVTLAKKMTHTRFDETVELHLRMGLDSKNATQQVRGVALLPHGLGKKVRVLIFAQGEAARTAETNGADYVGGDELIQKIEGGWLEFDTAIATPDMMGKVGKLGKILGRKGLMPNPKAGTVVAANDLPRIIQMALKGRVEFKLDRTAIIHVPVGKTSFTEDKLVENLTAVVEAVMKAKPSGAKGQYVKTASLTTTMGPGIKLDLKPTLALTAG